VKTTRARPSTGERKPGLHLRNRHARRHDFDRLTAACPELRAHLRRAPHGGLTVDFADPAAVRALNRALLADAYGIRGWDIPPGWLCPPVPGRADYLHHAADLLAGESGGRVPRGPGVRVLDVGTGASAIYPLIGHREYGWSFVGTDVDEAALASAARILAANPGLVDAIVLRRQADSRAAFAGVVHPGERFELVVCNPPFHASARAAAAAAREKWRKLGRGAASGSRNFGGTAAELWCEGGEQGFLRRMAEESAAFASQVRWFSSLVSSAESLPAVQRALRRTGARRVRAVPMAQGQKRSRFLAWSFV
jgi:23S rRNA (adenine1618-N6)-methyltransferase